MIKLLGINVEPILGKDLTDQLEHDLATNFDDFAPYVEILLAYARDNELLPCYTNPASAGDPVQWLFESLEVVNDH